MKQQIFTSIDICYSVDHEQSRPNCRVRDQRHKEVRHDQRPREQDSDEDRKRKSSGFQGHVARSSGQLCLFHRRGLLRFVRFRFMCRTFASVHASVHVPLARNVRNGLKYNENRDFPRRCISLFFSVITSVYRDSLHVH